MPASGVRDGALFRDGPGSGGIARGSRAAGMAGVSHLRGEGVCVFPGGTLGARVSLRAATEIEPAAGCVESWTSQPQATASTTKRNPVHNLLWELMTVVGLRSARRMKADTIGRDGTIMALRRVESTERLMKIW